MDTLGWDSCYSVLIEDGIIEKQVTVKFLKGWVLCAHYGISGVWNFANKKKKRGMIEV